MKTFDPKKDHGTVMGEAEGRVYEQDGTFFCADGSEWTEPVARNAKVVGSKALKAIDPAAPAGDPAADSQLSSQLGGQ